ncbi:hypothetical protein [Clostridium chrysemydis]|uniref:hypothetical protein n=1 Tax=Clostridium chrysemydis TaxID=2665504 RepID=UPI00188361FC|nr:hypothetical protein [Clostridium chrysemydis]
MFKKFIISKLAKIKIVESKRGMLTVKLDILEKIPEEYMFYQTYLKDALKILEGVEDVIVNLNLSQITIIYNENLLNRDRLLSWIEKVKEIGLKNYDFIEQNGENNLEGVVDKLTLELNEAKKEI